MNVKKRRNVFGLKEDKGNDYEIGLEFVESSGRKTIKVCNASSLPQKIRMYILPLGTT